MDHLPTSIIDIINLYADEIKLNQINKKDNLITQMNKHIKDWNLWNGPDCEMEALTVLVFPLKFDHCRYN